MGASTENDGTFAIMLHTAAAEKSGNPKAAIMQTCQLPVEGFQLKREAGHLFMRQSKFRTTGSEQVGRLCAFKTGHLHYCTEALAQMPGLGIQSNSLTNSDRNNQPDELGKSWWVNENALFRIFTYL